MPQTHKIHHWYDEIDFARIEKLLQEDEIIGNPIPIKEFFASTGKTPSGVNREQIFIIRFKSGIWGVWKTAYPRIWEGEYYGYVLARRVKFKLAPPTVEREINGVYGSLQYFIPSSADLAKMNMNDLPKILENLSDLERSDRVLYLFVFGQNDFAPKNMILDDSGGPAQIDNGGVAGPVWARYGEDFYIGKFKLEAASCVDATTEPKDFPYDLAFEFINPTLETLVSHFGSQVSPARIERFWEGEVSKRKNKDMRMVVWHNYLWYQFIKGNPPLQTSVYSEATLRDYATLSYEELRGLLPERTFPDQSIQGMIHRRDQILEAAAKAKTP